jgi:zona occludens toxin (predicted ATPase)
MAEHDEYREGPEERVPLGQRLFDSPFLLLLVGLLTMGLFYSVWGLVELLSLPEALLP